MLYLGNKEELNPPTEVIGVLYHGYYLSEASGRPAEIVPAFDVYDRQAIRDLVPFNKENIDQLIIWRLEIFDRNRLPRLDSRLGYYIELEICNEEADGALYPVFQDDMEVNFYHVIIKHINVFTIYIDPFGPFIELAVALDSEMLAVQRNQVAYYSKRGPSSDVESQFIQSIDKGLVNFRVEPIAQGNYIRFEDENQNSVFDIDAGYGTPLRKRDFNRWVQHPKLRIDLPKALLLTHWDNDHYRLLEIQQAIDVNNIFLVFPFDFNGGLSYERRPSVLRIIATALKLNQAIVLQHQSHGSFITQHFTIEYEVGDSAKSRNNAGVAYRLNSKNSRHLFPGDKCYSELPQSWQNQSYETVIASHHGSENLNFRQIPLPNSDNAELIFSFGTHDHHQHPRPSVINHPDGYYREFCMDENWTNHVSNQQQVDKYRHWEQTAKSCVRSL